MQACVDNDYDVFKEHEVGIRGKRLKKPIDDLAGGRVDTGRRALEPGLLDKIGNRPPGSKRRSRGSTWLALDCRRLGSRRRSRPGARSTGSARVGAGCNWFSKKA